MKNNNLAESVKFLLIGASLIITCTLIMLGFYLMDVGSRLGHQVSNNLSAFQAELSEQDIMKFHGLEVAGSDVINFIKKNLGGYDTTEEGPFTVTVVSNTRITNHVNNNYIIDITNFTKESYIKPIAKYKGTIVKNENDVIILAKFEQQ